MVWSMLPVVYIYLPRDSEVCLVCSTLSMFVHLLAPRVDMTRASSLFLVSMVLSHDYSDSMTDWPASRAFKEIGQIRIKL